MKIEYSDYELTSGEVSRSGILLRIEGGVADLHSWPELGDQSLVQLLEDLRAQNFSSPLLARARYFAGIDAQARKESRWLFEGKKFEIPNHYLLPSHFFTATEDERDELLVWIFHHGFRELKWKERSVVECLSHLRLMGKEVSQYPFKFRIDFNHRVDADVWTAALKDKDLFSQVEFVEDPMPYDLEKWIAFAESFGVKTCLDQGTLEQKSFIDHRVDLGTAPVGVVCVKPAREESTAILKSAAENMRRVYFSGYLGHPVGQVAAYYEAMLGFQQHPLLIDSCGLLNHLGYDKNDFSKKFKIEDTVLIPPRGFGFGFDDELEALEWKSL